MYTAAGNIVGKGFSVQANLMSNDRIWPAMEKAFKNSAGSLAERMLKHYVKPSNNLSLSARNLNCSVMN